MRQLTIDSEFQDKIPPLSPEEFAKLEENILADGEVREPLVVWQNTIIDGHHRWAVIRKHPELPYKVKQMEFPDKWAAIVWICRNQLGRRNITGEQKTALIGEAYRAQKLTRGAQPGNANAKIQSHQNEAFESGRREKTRAVIAKQFGVGATTVERAERFIDGLDAAEEVAPGIREAILSGEVKAPKSTVAEIRNAPVEIRPAVVEAIMQGRGGEARAIMKSHEPKQEEAPEDEKFTPEDLVELLDAAANNLDFAYKLHLVLTHRDMLNDERVRGLAVAAINKAIGVANKYLDMIERIEGHEGA